MRTAESVLLTCWPPAPDARYVSIWRSSSSISTSPASSTTGATSTPGERRLAPVGGVERGEPHEPVHALLGGVQAVGVLALGAERRRLDAGLLPRARLEQLDLEAAPLGPAHHHPQHHLGPVLRVGAAGAGVDGHERVARVVGAGEQPLLLERGEPLLDRGQRLLQLGRQLGILLGELDEPVEVGRVGLELVERLEPALQARVLGVDLGGGVGLVPEAGLAHLRLERGGALLQASRVKDSPRAGTSARGWRRGAAGWSGSARLAIGREASAFQFGPGGADVDPYGDDEFDGAG